MAPSSEQARHAETSTIELREHRVSNPLDNGTLAVGQATPDESPLESPTWKIITCAYSFFISGVNDGVLGPLVPYILRSFRLSTGELAYLYVRKCHSLDSTLTCH